MSLWLKTFPPLTQQMSESRRTHSPERIEALRKFLKLTNNPNGENFAEVILENPDPWMSQVLLLDCIQQSIHPLEQLQRKAAANEPQTYVRNASDGMFPIGNPDLYFPPMR